MEKYSAFFKRPEVRITAVCIALLAISFWSEIMHWWYTVLILTIAIPLAIRYWEKRLFLMVILLLVPMIWGSLIYLFPPKGAEVFHSGMVLLYALGSFCVLFFGGIALISQFVLPVQTFEERRGVFGRLMLYILGKHGPALFVREAKVQASEEEKKRKGHGIVLVDANSAAALQRDKLPKPPAKAIRIIGPGIAFIHPNEKLREKDILDLRKQSRTVTNVKALTREGITVTVTINLIFHLAQPPKSPSSERNQPPYPFDPESAFRAIYGHAIGSAVSVPWADLPAIVAKEIYRDIISRETLDRLFHPQRPIGEDPLSALKNTFTGTMKNNRLLKDRGIEILSANLTSFNFSEDAARNADGKNVVQAQRLETWLTEWRRREIEAKAGGDLEAERIKRRARIDAQREWMSKLTQIIQEQGTISKRVVVMRLFQALESAASDPSTRKLLPNDTIQMLSSVRDWLNFDE